eukprot:m.243399 g.243399  ORF g.243399 m.243399 type:complete len:735 (-) comp14233_c0_seq1:218-2422(-)
MAEDNFELNIFQSAPKARPAPKAPAAAPAVKPVPAAAPRTAFIKTDSKKAEHARARAAASGGAPAARPAGNGEHATKKGASFVPSSAPRHAHAETGEKRKRPDQDGSEKKPKRPEGVISSLFSFNPEISTHDVHVAEPQKAFEIMTADTYAELPINKHLVDTLDKRMGITTLTIAQRMAIPHLLQHKDVLLKSPTGSGKTLAYAVPIVQAMLSAPKKVERADGVLALVLTPTRELALQTLEVFTHLLYSCVGIVPGAVMGGEKKKAEKARLRKGVSVLIGTPGRLLDHLQHTQSLRMDNLQWLVLDEADRLTDQGFEKEVGDIVGLVNQYQRKDGRRTNVLLSATLTDSVKRLAQISLNEPTLVDAVEDGSEDKPKPKPAKVVQPKAAPAAALAAQEPDDAVSMDSDAEEEEAAPETYTTAAGLEQYFAVVPAKQRLVALLAFLQAECVRSEGKAIVFFSTRDAVRYFELLLAAAAKDTGPRPLGDLPLFYLHGGAAQQERTRAYFAFCKATKGVLFCTDVAARGLDMPMVKWIVQASPPSSIPEYIHRVGRTARMQTSGSSLLLLLVNEVEFASTLGQAGMRLTEKKVDDLLRGLVPRAPPTPAGVEQAHEKATDLQIQLERIVLHDATLHEAAKAAFQSTIGSYSTYPASLKHIFNVKFLHLGHFAKSFALRDAPSEGQSKKSKKTKHGKDRKDRDGEPKRRKTLKETVNEEFGAGSKADLMVKRSKPGKRK